MDVSIWAAVSANFVNSYVLGQVFPYVGFMVVDLEGGTKEQAGFKAGWLASAFMLSRIPASFVWGFFGDKYGRRPVMLLGTFTMFFFSLVFGLSESYFTAVGARLCMGLFSGVVGTSKTVVSELAAHSAKGQASAMNKISAAGAMGMIAGPALSGVLYDPVGQFPGTWVADYSVLERFKFLLPNLVCAMFALISFTAILLWVPETLPDPEPLVACRSARLTQSVYSTLPQHGEQLEMANVVEKNAQASTDTHHIDSDQLKDSSFSAFLIKIRQLWQRKKVRKSALPYAFYSFISMFFSEVFPLWLLAKKPVGGFEYDSKMIGFAISCSALLLLMFQVFVFRFVSTWSTPIHMLSVYQSVMCIFYLQLPFAVVLNGYSPKAVMAGLILQRSAQNILNQLSFNQLNVITNNSVATRDRATANGIVMGVGSIFKSLGPISAGSLFAWSVTNGSDVPPFNFVASFATLSFLSLALSIYAKHQIPTELNSFHVDAIDPDQGKSKQVEEDCNSENSSFPDWDGSDTEQIPLSLGA